MMSKISLVLTLLLFTPLALAADAQPTTQPTVAAPTKNAEVPATKKVVDEPKVDAKAVKEVKADQEEKPKVQAWWQGLVYGVVFKVIMPIFATVLSALLFWLLRKWGFNIELVKLDKIAGDAATYAEKKGAEWLRENGEKSGGAKKVDWAWEFVDMVDAKLKANRWTRDKLRGMILAKVPAAEEMVAKAEAAKANGVPTPPVEEPA